MQNDVSASRLQPMAAVIVIIMSEPLAFAAKEKTLHIFIIIYY